MNELALFAGAGGGILGGMLLGWRTVAAVEIEDYPRRVLLQRQRDGILPRFPIWDDVTIFDGRPWRGKVDVISGGFPCQDISYAGKGEGLTGPKSKLWWDMFRIVGEVRPRFVFVENSPALTLRGLRSVLAALSGLGYDAKWGTVSAENAGSDQGRTRIWIVANANLERRIRENHEREQPGRTEAIRTGENCTNWKTSVEARPEAYRRELEEIGRRWWGLEPAVGRVAHGVAHRVDRLKALGNGQVPQAMALAWRILSQGIE